jgi:hypothetical protein
MKEINTRRLKDVLAHHFGFAQIAGGKTGRDTWTDRKGRRIHPLTRHKSVSIAALYCTGMEMEAQGICSRTDFMRKFKN